MIIFENEYTCIEYDEESEILFSRWKKYVTSALYREAVTKYFEFRAQHHITKVVSDTRNLPVITTSDAQWTAEMMKKYSKIPLKKNAVVVSQPTFTNLSIRMMLDEYNKSNENPGNYNEGNNLRYFTSLEEAIAWVNEETQEGI